ncbi:hypothetical protein A2U01_0112433, partial [Trifolium medium]|nr:hypothetical protein [Trifolium medium]
VTPDKATPETVDDSMKEKSITPDAVQDVEASEEQTNPKAAQDVEASKDLSNPNDAAFTDSLDSSTEPKA